MLFDAHLHPETLSDLDLESLRAFGVEEALVLGHHFPEPTAACRPQPMEQPKQALLLMRYFSASSSPEISAARSNVL